MNFVTYFSSIHPFIDLLIIGLPVYTILLLIGLLFSRNIIDKKLKIIIAVIISINFIKLGKITPVENKISNSNFTLVQHNVYFKNGLSNISKLTNSHDPDVLTLQEVRQKEFLTPKLASYSYKSICNFAAVGAVAVLSKHKFIKKGCSKGRYRGLAWGQILTKDGKKLTIASVHLHWPYPNKQSQQVDELLPLLAGLPQPVVLAGDFNQVPWSNTTTQIAKSIGGKVQNKLMITFFNPPFILPIDHVIAPFPTSVKKLGRMGSDHNALLAKFKI